MDAHLFRLFAREATNILTGAWLEKIQAPAPGILTLSLFAKGGKRQLVWRHERQKPFCYFSGLKLGTGQTPPAPVMRLRKYLQGKRVATAIPQFCQRRLWLMAADTAAAGKAAWLCLDLAQGSQLHFLAPADTPLPDSPRWPQARELEQALQDWRNWPILTPALRRSLALLAPAERQALLLDLEQGGGDVFLYSSPGTRREVKAVSAWPLPQNQRGDLFEEARCDILAALETAGDDLVAAPLAARTLNQLQADGKKRRRKLVRILASLQNDERRLQAMLARAPDALALQANLWRLDAGQHCAAITLPDTGKTVKLDKSLSIRANMESLFRQATRGRRGLKLLEERRGALEQELAALADTPGPARPAGANAVPEKLRQAGRAMPKNIAAFVSSDGYLLLRGKDAAGNRAVRRMAAPHDLWAHVETGPGAHVVIRRPNPARQVPETTLAEAGALAAAKSWLGRQDQAPVMYAEIRHVRPVRGEAATMSIARIAMTRLVKIIPDLERKLAPENDVKVNPEK